LLPTSLSDVLHDFVVNVRVGDNHAAATVTVPNRDRCTLLLVSNLLLRKIANEDGLAGQLESPLSIGEIGMKSDQDGRAQQNSCNDLSQRLVLLTTLDSYGGQKEEIEL
jgi:hypothetical protein